MLEWPLWVHPRAAGELELRYVLYYEPASPVEGMKYRCAPSPFILIFKIKIELFYLRRG